MGHATALLIALSALSFLPHAALGQDADDGEAAGLVATQVREQGHACDEPVSATRDADSESDAVWTLSCANATYRVRLVPDMAADIERID